MSKVISVFLILIDGKQKKNDVVGESRNFDSLFMSRVVAYVSCDIDIGAAFETA